jgi:hypothetical protein
LAKRLKIDCLKIIHGYGSSGTGGRIRVAVRRRLIEHKNKKIIKSFITGEEFSIFNKETIGFLDKCQSIRNDHDLNRSNNGVTLYYYNKFLWLIVPKFIYTKTVIIYR